MMYLASAKMVTFSELPKKKYPNFQFYAYICNVVT
nr:MAG TPA_asm: hypothetical protein [Bacteriophage sp.]